MEQFITDIYNVPSPVGIDLEIAKIQAKLAGIKWLHTCFGRANLQRRQLTDEEVKNRLTQTAGVKGKDLYFLYYPQGRFRGIDYDLSFSDAYPSVAFFYLKDSTNVSPRTDKWDFTEDQVMIEQPMSLICSHDLRKLDTTSNDNFAEQLKLTYLYELNKVPRIVVNNVWDNSENVLQDFSITQKLSTYTRFPYCAFRFDIVCTYPAFPENGNGAFNPATGTVGRAVIGWRACKIVANVVTTPGPATQTLDNGDVIALEYAANLDGSLTIPELTSVPDIGVLSGVLLNGAYYDDMVPANGTFGTNHGKFQPGDIFEFNATLPIYNI